MTGMHWIKEGSTFAGPVGLINTHDFGIMRHALARWMVRKGSPPAGACQWTLPVVAETCDAYLNDMDGFYTGEEHALQAIEAERRPGLGRLAFLPSEASDRLFEATARAVEESIVNALMAAHTTTDRDGRLHRPQDGRQLQDGRLLPELRGPNTAQGRAQQPE